FISAYGSHRGERVHALGARGAWHQLDRERGDAGVRNLLHDLFRAERAQKSDEYLIAAKQRYILLPRKVVGTVAKNLHDNVSGGKHRGAIRNNLRALVGILGIRIAGLVACAGLYMDFESGLG